MNSVILQGMGRAKGAVHVVRVRKSHTDKAGHRRDYESGYLRRTFRDGGKVRNETVANLSSLPGELVEGDPPLAVRGVVRARGPGRHDHPVGATRPRRRGLGPGKGARPPSLSTLSEAPGPS